MNVFALERSSNGFYTLSRFQLLFPASAWFDDAFRA
jgi:hypothetical protein